MSETEHAETLEVEAGKPASAASTATVTDPPENDKPELSAEEREEAERAKQTRESSIQKLKRQREEARREAEHWRNEAMKPRQAEQRADPEPASAAGKPAPESFKTLGEYMEALADWKADQKVVAHAKTQRESAERQQQIEQARSWEKREAEARTKYPDYDEVVTEDVEVSAAMGKAILASPNGTDIAYYLGKNPDEAARIAQMGNEDAKVEIRVIERLHLTKPDGARGATKTASAAPAPITPVSRASRVEVDPDKLSTRDWLAMRRKQLQAGRPKRA